MPGSKLKIFRRLALEDQAVGSDPSRAGVLCSLNAAARSHPQSPQAGPSGLKLWPPMAPLSAADGRGDQCPLRYAIVSMHQQDRRSRWLTTVSGSAMRWAITRRRAPVRRCCSQYCAGRNRRRHFGRGQARLQGLVAAGERNPFGQQLRLARQVFGQLPLLCAGTSRSLQFHSRLSPAPPGVRPRVTFGALINQYSLDTPQPPERPSCVLVTLSTTPAKCSAWGSGLQPVSAIRQMAIRASGRGRLIAILTATQQLRRATQEP